VTKDVLPQPPRDAGICQRGVTRRSIISQGAKFAVGGVAAGALGSAIWRSATPAEAITGSPPPFDFSDAFYRANGINPANILSRVNGTPPDSVIDNSNTDPDFRNVRVRKTTGGFDHAGTVLYYVILGMVMPSTFTNDAAGQRARAIADSSTAYIFPKASGDPLSPDIGNRRQDNVFETISYLGVPQNPLGIWTAVFVSYAPAALNTAAGQKRLAELASMNGRDLDGTPIITKSIEVDDLEKQGFVATRTRAKDGSQGFPWII
jgi:hypothetical protein